MRRFALLATLLVASVALPLVESTATAVARAYDPPLDAAAAEALERQIDRALEAHKYAEAIPLMERYLAEVRLNPIMIYNVACCHAKLGDRDASVTTLLRAIKAGFRDFDAMETDPDLESIRDHPTYTAILEARDRVRKQEADATPSGATPGATAPGGPIEPNATLTCPQLEDWKQRHGEKGYTFDVDPKRRLFFALALEDESRRSVRELIEREADHLSAFLFGDTPPYATFIAVPTPKDSKKYFADPTTTGVYEHSTRALVSRDIGESLQHEFVHLMHYGHMERLRQKHPIWIQEGLASLYERYELNPDGTATFLPNTRHNLIRRQVTGDTSMPWKKLFSLSAKEFMDRSQTLYPQVRSIFEFLADRGKLQDFYTTYTKGWKDDSTGQAAMERIFGRPLAEVERTWKDWVRERGPLDDTVTYGDASLGISIAEIADGIRIRDTQPRGAARSAGLRIGDVIVSVDGKATRSQRELALALSNKKVGENVVVRFRRGDDYREANVTLRPLAPTLR
ncbi:MAG: PDZ domain-containing protein [Phycisphaerae bacterium]|nr:PDZ domain-containing protein [Phycisphaerae bacterium]